MELNELFPIEVKSVFSKTRKDSLNVNGWGYKDSYFSIEDGHLTFIGDRYDMSNRKYPKAVKTFKEILNIKLDKFTATPIKIHKESDYQPAIENAELCAELEKMSIDFSTSFDDRFIRCRGQGIKDLYILRYGKFNRIPDLVVWPKSHEEVIFVVQQANKYCAIIIPYAGGTNTMMSLSYTKKSERFLISLDTTQMNRILWIDRNNMLACFESGIVGIDMERELNKRGLTVGHYPDSIEFSTLGGWVATNSSGIKQQTYGNIEDIVNRITLVTSVGVLEKNFLAPRVSCGPNFDHIVIGCEGTLGVITKIVTKIRPFPKVQRYGSVVFHDFQTGVNFMREVSKFSRKPSSVRLIDNNHFKLGFSFSHNKNALLDIAESIKLKIIDKLLKYDFNKIAVLTYLIEGDKDDVDDIEMKLKAVCRKYKGLNTGKKYSEHTYTLTYLNAYIRDIFIDIGYLFDSLEPSVTWDKCMLLIEAIRNTWNAEMKQRKLSNFLAIRISQVYDAGACVYFYYSIGPTTDKDQLETFEELTDILRKTIHRAHGSISHHHGIGKKNQKWYPQSISKVGVDIFTSIKSKIDPNNVFDCGNLIDVDCKL